MEAYIKSISTYFPIKSYTNEQIEKDFPEWEGEQIVKKIGIKNRFISDDNETSSGMATRAIMTLIDENNIDKNSIDFLLVCTQSPDYNLPTTACIVQDNCGLPISCGALDFNQGCSGYIYGLSLAKGLIAAKVAKNIILVTSETYTKYIHKKDKGNRSIFGDAATATLISTEGILKIEDFVLGSDGSGAENLIVKNGGSKNKTTIDTNEPSENNLFMDGPVIFNFTSKMVPPLIDSVLEKNSLELSDVDQFIFHQANTFMLNYLRKKIKIDQDKFVIDMENYGNTVSSTIPIVLKNLMNTDSLKNNVVLAGFGVGYSWGAVYLHK